MRSILLVLFIAGAACGQETVDLAERVQYLLDRLDANHNRQLYYDFSRFTPPMWALIRLRGVGQLIIDNRGRHDGKTYRFSVMTVLVHRVTVGGFDDDVARIGPVLVGSLRDADAWIRTECVWGIKEIGYVVAPDRVAPLLHDADDHVRDEAADAYDFLVRMAGRSL